MKTDVTQKQAIKNARSGLTAISIATALFLLMILALILGKIPPASVGTYIVFATLFVSLLAFAGFVFYRALTDYRKKLNQIQQHYKQLSVEEKIRLEGLERQAKLASKPKNLAKIAFALVMVVFVVFTLNILLASSWSTWDAPVTIIGGVFILLIGFGAATVVKNLVYRLLRQRKARVAIAAPPLDQVGLIDISHLDFSPLYQKERLVQRRRLIVVTVTTIFLVGVGVVFVIEPEMGIGVAAMAGILIPTIYYGIILDDNPKNKWVRRMRQTAAEQFAKHNGLSTSSVNLGLHGLWNCLGNHENHRLTTIALSDQILVVSFYMGQVKTASGVDGVFVRYQLPNAAPHHLLLRSIGGPSAKYGNDSVINLDYNLDEHFTLFGNATATEALSIFTPDILLLATQHGITTDIELHDKYLFITSSVTIDEVDKFKDFLAYAGAVAKKIGS
jgi:hypothetical protein